MAELTPQLLQFNPDVQQALQAGTPVVALETTVITHGLPFPQNLQLAQNVESEVRSQGSLPATIGILDGVIKIGMEQRELEKLIHQENLHKLSSRDLGAAVALGWSGGTTVAGTIAAAELAGIRTFATGGIGGVHRGSAWDVSADLIQLAKTPVLVVCSGAKSILNLPATLEFLETHCVPVIGYQTDEFPAFYSKSSGLKVSARVRFSGTGGTDRDQPLVSRGVQRSSALCACSRRGLSGRKLDRMYCPKSASRCRKRGDSRTGSYTVLAAAGR